MANTNAFLQTFAGGEFGNAMSSRVGIEAYQASCEVMENFYPTAQGPMTRRPPLSHIDLFTDSSLKGILKAFQFDVGQNYLLLLTANGIEFFLNDGKLEIPEITGEIANGTFATFTGWTDNSGTGSSAGATGGVLRLTCNGATDSKARTTFTVNEADETHVIRFTVVNGPVNLRIGSSAGGEQYLDEQELRTGLHQLSFVPATGTCHIEFWFNGKNGIKRVDDISIMDGPAFIVASPWAEEDMRGVYAAQDGDRLFMFHRNYAPKVLERRAHRSWSLIDFEPDNGPYDTGDQTIRLAPSATVGETTLTASRALFTANDVRRLVRLTHAGQATTMVAASDGIYGEAIKVSGIGIDRRFTAVITGTFVGTVTLQRSVGNENQYVDVLTFTNVLNVIYNDSYDEDTDAGAGTNNDLHGVSAQDDQRGTLNNLTVFYRWAIKPGNYTSGTITATLSTSLGSTVGNARIVAFASSTSVTVEILDHFGATGATDIWDFGAWNPVDEYPNAVAFSAGRLWTARRRRIFSSESDDYFSFLAGTNANNAIDITLRSKSSEGVRWMRHLDFLCVGTRNEEYVLRPATVAEPIGPGNIEPALMSEEGGALIEAVVGGDSILFVHRSLRRLFQFAHNPRALTESSFVAIDLNRLNSDAVKDGILNVAIQQEPERRIYVITKSGIAKTALFRREEEIVAWSTFRSEAGFIEDVCVFPENDVDAVYFIVRRRIGGNYVRMIERLGNELTINDEDLVHLDSMLETDIERPDAILTFDEWEAQQTVTVMASESVFTALHENQILWADKGRIRLDTYVGPFEMTGTILNSMAGEQDPDDEDAILPVAVPPLQWGIAPQVTSVTGLDHLEGETVRIWADKANFGTAVVTGGAVSLPQAASRVFVGLRVISRWMGLKLAFAAQKGTAVNQIKQVSHLGFVLTRTSDGVKFGQNFKRMKALVTQSSSPVIEAGVPYFTGERHESFNGFSTTDPRLSLKADTPGPATIGGLVPNVQINER